MVYYNKVRVHIGKHIQINLNLQYHTLKLFNTQVKRPK